MLDAVKLPTDTLTLVTLLMAPVTVVAPVPSWFTLPAPTPEPVIPPAKL